MFKATTNNAHWLPRTGSFSTHGQRNGRVDVLPPSAKTLVYADIEERRNELIRKLHSVKQQMEEMREARKKNPACALFQRLSLDAKLRGGLAPNKPREVIEFDDAYAALKAEARRIDELLSGMKEDRLRRREEAFVSAARDLLDAETFRLVMEEARRRCGQP